jgi:hypothetical protein
MELEEFEILLQAMWIRYLVWVPSPFEDGHADILTIGSYHPFGTQIPGTSQISLEPGSMRCLFQSLLNFNPALTSAQAELQLEYLHNTSPALIRRNLLIETTPIN